MAGTSQQIQLPSNFEDHLLALQGITLMLNNGFNESEQLFNKFKCSSPLMSAGSSFVSFMQGLMSFEEEKLEKAIVALKETQKLCHAADEGLMDVFKKRFRKKEPDHPPLSKTEMILRKVICADCYLYTALIHFIKQDLTGYIKGGWSLRKAWKIYEKSHHQIADMLKAHNLDCIESGKLGFVNGDPNTGGASTANGGLLSGAVSSPESSDNEEFAIDRVKDMGKVQGTKRSSDDAALLRLYGAVSFGFGAFNLCVSLVPQHLLRVVNMMGFCGDRDVGLKSLEIAYESEDMKSPLAMLCLLWYHTVVRPFFAVDGDSTDAGLPEAEELLRNNEEKYPSSSLVLFFKGRILRCKCDINGALAALQLSYDKAKELRELQLLCNYEIGWCCIMQLQWERALENIERLKNESKWAVCYYTYLTALIHGAMHEFNECQELMAQVPKAMKRKSNQLEVYVVRKAKVFEKIPPTFEHVILLIIELIYLWRALPNCETESIQKMLTECQAVSNPCLNGTKQLLLGALYKKLNDFAKAASYFQQAIQVSEQDLEDGHIAPFACYELAVLLVESPESRTRGLDLLHQCKENFSGHDFENRLHMRIHALELRIKKEQAQSS